MRHSSTSGTVRLREARRASRSRSLRPLLLLAAGFLTLGVLLAQVPSASAELSICTPGTAAGQCSSPQGVAVDFETARLYVADRGNNRIDVFESDGTFVMAFGWGVDTGASEFQTCDTASTCQAGTAGSGAGQFSSPSWIAVDNDPSSTSQHDIYVGTDSFRVQKFKPTGGSSIEFVKSFGEKGKGPCQFEREVDPIAVGPEGKLYVADWYEEGPSNRVNRIIVFDAAGNCLAGEEIDPLFEGIGRFSGFAVDSKGNFYVTIAAEGGALRKYDPSGVFLYQLGNFETEGIAVDGADNLFAKQQGPGGVHFFTQYPSNEPVPTKRFGYGDFTAPGLAAYSSPNGDLFASREATGVRYLSLPPAGPVLFPEPCRVKPGGLGNTKATLVAEVNPEGKATTFRFQYVDEESFKESGWSNPEEEVKETPESESIGSDFVLHEASAQTGVLVPETKYRCRAIATNADGSATGEEGSFTTLEPLEIGDTTVSDVGTEEATLNATVNPLGIPTSGYFEYVEEATYLKDIAELGPEHGFDHASKAPNVDEGEEPVDYGAGESFKAGSAQLSGLKPGTSYRFRVVATDSLIAPDPPPNEVIGPTESFHTYGVGTEALADDRAWELVSPAQKNGAEVAVPGPPRGFVEDGKVRTQAGATSGEAVTYTSWTSFGEAEGAPATNQYLSRRTAAGWETENISPFGFLYNPLAPPFTGFSPDLRLGAMYMSEPSLAPGCPEEYANLYLRDNESGTLTCLTSEAPNSPPGSTNCFTFAGASDDGSRAFFSSRVPYAGAPVGEGTSLYEWSAEEGLRAASVLPGQTDPVPPANVGLVKDTSFGAAGDNCRTGQSIMRHVVSADGSKAIWTYGGDKYRVKKGSTPSVPCEPAQSEAECEIVENPLFVRLNGSETIQLDAKVSGGGKPGNGVFWAASSDGSVVYFTDANRLITGSKSEEGKPDLYRYEFGKPTPLTNLTKGSVPGDVKGVVGANDDGSHIYFVAGAALTGDEENGAGQKAIEGKDNLYLHQEGKTSFIAILGSEENVRTEQTENLASRVSADGRHLVFLSSQAKELVGYDNTVADGTIAAAQAFLYDAETQELTCASCNPSGARPLGPTLLPGWTNDYEGPRYLSHDGSRLFFETFDALLPSDQNSKRDVYEFELEGKGTCTSESPSFDPVSGGCHSLISSGKSTDESYLVDASSDGRDAFFSTRRSLVGWDTNENFDIYDAREGGGFPEPSPPPPICESEGCLSPVPPPPGTSSPATPHFHQDTQPPCPKGKGSRKGRCESPRPRCPKGKVHRKTRCVRPGQNRKPPRKRASHKRRAVR
jgi:NHL repeat